MRMRVRSWLSMASPNTVDLEPMTMDCLDQDENLIASNSSATDAQFDNTIGHIEDIIMDEEFQTIQNNFMEKYWEEFEDTEENKFSYTDIHKEYTELIEKYLEAQLHIRMPNFSMTEFQKQIISRKEELEGEVFEMLLTFSDFMAFKEMFLDYRAAKEGRTVDFSEGLTVTSLVHNQDSSTNGPSLLSLGGVGLQLGGSGLSLGGASAVHVGGTGDTSNGNIDEEPMHEGTPRGEGTTLSHDDILQ